MKDTLNAQFCFSSFPFFDGKEQHQKCNPLGFPSLSDEMCLEARNYLNTMKGMLDPYEPFTLMFNKERKSTICYP